MLVYMNIVNNYCITLYAPHIKGACRFTFVRPSVRKFGDKGRNVGASVSYMDTILVFVLFTLK